MSHKTNCYQKNKEKLLNRAKENYENNKVRLRQQAKNKYRELSNEENDKKKENKQRLKTIKKIILKEEN